MYFLLLPYFPFFPSYDAFFSPLRQNKIARKKIASVRLALYVQKDVLEEKGIPIVTYSPYHISKISQQ